MSGKTWAQMTPAERHEAAIAADAADNFSAEYTARRLGMAEAEVTAILARQKQSWDAKRPARIKAAQVQWPKQAPKNVCIDCIALWARGVTIGRKAGVAEPRSIACCHPPHADGTTYAVAFLIKGKAPTWIQIAAVPAPELNALYSDLVSTNGSDFVGFARQADTAACRAAEHSLARAQRLKWAPMAAVLAGVLKP